MERFGSTSHRGFSVRSILTFVLAVIITTLLWVIIGGQATHALGDTDASWSGDTIIYDGHGFTKTTDFKDTTGTIPSGVTIYQAPLQAGATTGSQKALIIYFSSGVDPPTAKTAKYVEFEYSKSAGTSNPQNKKDIKLTVKGKETQLQSCSVEGIGWIICPISTFLSGGMDFIFHLLAGMISVQPSVLGDPSNSMYIAWNIMRNIANIAFVIVFLIIIYSQLTSFGVSNYGLKKLIPRLIIAAILVNVSFIVSAVAIDISNILGYSIQSIFNEIAKNVFNVTNDNFSGANAWTAITGIVLAGGGYIGVTYFISSGGIYLLLPILLGVLLTVIFVVIVLAARQAIIIILVIISPLAFVANLLPNTEKWFDKWKDLFFTMLIFFPAFSLVFGGSQLAGQLIIQNAGDNIVMVIFGMAVQIAPLVITPLILKFSGSLLGKIAQIANNPSKGIMDRSKNWANSKSEQQKQRTLSKNRSWWNTGGKLMEKADTGARKTKDRTELYKLRADNKYQGTNKAYEQIHVDMAGAELDKDYIHNVHATHVEHLKTTPGSSLYDRASNTEASKDFLQASQNLTNQHFNERRIINGTPLNVSSNQLESSKATLETSENEKNVYLNRQRMMAGSVLNATVAPLETSKLRVESTQNQYTAMVEKMKLDPVSGLYHVAQGAQSSKELVEAAQSDVQALFDSQRRVKGTGLNLSTITLEESKASAEASKSLTARYVNDQKADENTALHLNIVRAEDAKLGAQVAETNLNRVIEEYKTGQLTRSGELDGLMESMVDNVSDLAAESQGVQAAQNIQKKNIAEAFTAVEADGKTRTSRAQELLDIAGSIDPDGGVRAEAGALSTLERIIDEARGSNMKLVESRALHQGKTVKNYAVELLENRLEGDMSQSEDLMRAALEIAGQEAQIPVLRKVRRSKNFDQEDVNAMLNRQQNIMKAKGGFDLQSNFDLANVSEETMDASIAGTLGSTAAKDFAGLKFAAIKDYADRIDDIVTHTEEEQNPRYGASGRQGLESTYFNLSIALKDEQLIRELGDNLAPAIDMHKRLHQKFHNPKSDIDYDAIDPRKVESGPVDPNEQQS
jgi:hypothetical protein